MAILFNEKEGIFHLQAGDSSYVMKLYKKGYLSHVYWGKRLRSSNLSYALRTIKGVWETNHDPEDKTYSLDLLPMEYPSYGSTDLRHPAYQARLENGSTITDLRYVSHKISAGKPELSGLPATYTEQDDEAQTLTIELLDAVCGLRVFLDYTAYEKRNVITRSVRLENQGNEDLTLLRALSACVDFEGKDFKMLSLSGGYARERYPLTAPLTQGIYAVESRRGNSSHQHNPFLALLRGNADENHGEVYGFSLVYSGNFAATAEVTHYNNTRVTMGINPFDFSWLLTPGESFQTPETVMVYSADGITGMSHTYHDLYRSRLCRGRFRDQARPILVNNWEGTGMRFDEQKLLGIARVGAELGAELFVLDDGWFGKRNQDNCSLGDWVVNSDKIHGGLEPLVNEVNKLGMEFGLWFEPEMVSPDSDLYRAHPDWCLHVPNRTRSEERNQLILDFSRPEVVDAIFEMMSKILTSANITYVKWDMNRNMSEIGSAALPSDRQRETAHRYILGLYRLMEELNARFPHILFEGCAGGGGRFDPGILYYMPQIWTSDDTDAYERTKIQYGTSIVYPPITMGAHVAACHGRLTPLSTRGNVAMSGNLGYELDLTKISEEEKEAMRQQVALYKEIRQTVQFGDFYRIVSPFDEPGETGWIMVSQDKSEAFAVYAHSLNRPTQYPFFFRLKGLDPAADYLIDGKVYGGDELMQIGLTIPPNRQDFSSHSWVIRKQ